LWIAHEAATMPVALTFRQQGGAMKQLIFRAAALLAVALPAAFAHAQLEGLMGQGGGKDLKGLAGGLTGKSLTSGSMGNVAGLLQYCVTNNYLGGEDVNSVKEKLTGKLPGGTATQDPGYNDGTKGVLHSSGGQQLDLNKSGVQEQVSKQVCDTVLKQAKSFL
jgi:hypothetical protein